MSYKRNWRMILDTLGKEEFHLLWSLGLTVREDRLAALERAFPDFFYSNDYELKEADILIPLSVLMEAAKIWSRGHCRDPRVNTHDRHFMLSGAFKACPHLELPVLARWSGDVPLKIEEQLSGKLARAGMVVVWEGRACLILDIAWRGHIPEIGEHILRTPALHVVSLVDASLVELKR